MTRPPSTRPCVGCGALVPDVDGPTHAYIGASPGCWAIWGELGARAAGEAAIATMWPLAVDAYAVQHPGVPGRRSSQSVWVHLVSLCLIVERGRAPREGMTAKRELLATQRSWSWLEPPDDPGPLTVVDLAAAGSPNFDVVARRWAASVWSAWSIHAPAVRARTDRLLAGGQASRAPPRSDRPTERAPVGAAG